MRRIRSIILIFSSITFVAISVASCSKNRHNDEEFSPIELREIQTSITPDMEIGLDATRAAVVTASDPTATSIINRGAFAWQLDVKLYRGGVVYGPGTATFINNGTNSWIPQSPTIVYFPNYSTITGNFELYPTTSNAPVALDQSTANNLMRQDILALYNSTIIPAHIVNVTLKHTQSLIDFTFDRIPQGAKSVKVSVGGSTYTPYNVPGTSQYLLILPSVTTTTNPTVIITSASGTIYQQVVKIIGNSSIGSPTSLAVNVRYIFKLIGFELGLSPILVVDWVSGSMLAGDYVGITAYPTFRGPANSSCTLTFDTGLTQDLQFNAKGECTIKPVGRIIKQVTVGSISRPITILLNDMIIDLNDIISQCTSTI